MAADEGTKLPVASEKDKAGSLCGLKGIDRAVGVALTPAADEFGKELLPTGRKAGQLANRVCVLLIRALEPLVYGLEKSADWIERAVTERLKNVPPENVVSPNPRVAVPAMQALVYSMEDELIREMFANLLASDMNAEKKGDVHPAFVELIKEMTPADARVLKFCCDNDQCAFIGRVGTQVRYATLSTSYSFAVPGLSDNDIDISVNNLERLGLLERRDEFPARGALDDIEKSLNSKYEEQLQQLDTPENRKELRLPENAQIQLNFKRQGLYLNPLGSSFVAICLNNIAANF